jgi:hypothetical protein
MVERFVRAAWGTDDPPALEALKRRDVRNGLEAILVQVGGWCELHGLCESKNAEGPGGSTPFIFDENTPVFALTEPEPEPCPTCWGRVSDLTPAAICKTCGDKGYIYRVVSDQGSETDE